jgi:hypothetical protein
MSTTESVVATINKTMLEGKMTQLAPNRVMLAEQAHQTFVATPETETPPEALLDPKYWAHYSVHQHFDFKPGDIILVKPEDGSYFMELIVRAKTAGAVKVAELRRVVLDKSAEDVEDAGEHEIKWSGPRLKWRVIRKHDKREMKNALDTKDAARDWLREHVKAFKVA